MSNKPDNRLLKFVAFLSLVRWYNLFITVIAQYLFAYFAYQDGLSKWVIIDNYKLHLIVIASVLSSAAGFIINAFYDSEKDMVNRPKEMLIGTILSQKTSLNMYFALNILCLILAYLASIKIFIFFSLFIFALWFYSHKLQKIPFIREISASLLTVTSFFSVVFHYNSINKNILVYGTFYFLIIIIREFIKEFQNYKGDLLYNYRTLVVELGTESSRLITGLIMGLTGIPVVFIYFFNGLSPIFYSILLSISIVAICFTILVASVIGDSDKAKKNNYKSYSRINNLLKIVLIIGVIGVIYL